MLSRSLAAICAALLLVCAATARAQSVTYSTAVGGSIPDNNAAGINAVITVTDTFTIATFDSITITGLSHIWVGDVVVTLSHNGTTVDIFDRVRGNGSANLGDSSNLDGNYMFVSGGGADFNIAVESGGDNFTIPSNVSYNTLPVGNPNPTGGVSPANGALTDFNGETVNGLWTLNISDRFAGDIGSFAGFSFTVTPAQVGGAVPEPSAVVSALAFAGVIGGLVVRRRIAR